eukprot:Sspe_Gene.54313::Locus_29983_Transcript_2_5_Confidence_0.429_Length_974::g.54313::m.54313
MLVVGSLRGTIPPSDAVVINATSSSHYKLPDGSEIKKVVSPFFIGPVGGVRIFENWWQGGKAWPCHVLGGADGMAPPVKLLNSWLAFRKAVWDCRDPVRHPQKRFGVSGRACCASYESGVVCDYVSSRKYYVREYARLVGESKAVYHIRRLLKDGCTVCIMDYDGPCCEAYPHGRRMSQTAYDEVALDPGLPLGHGYVLAGLVLGLDLLSAIEQATVQVQNFTFVPRGPPGLPQAPPTGGEDQDG